MIQQPFYTLICGVFVFAGCAVTIDTEQPVISVRDVTDPTIHSFLNEMAQETHFSGVALVMRDGRIVHAKGYGAATHDRANDVDTAYHIASITKQFTAAAIMQLAERKVVELHDSINTYLPANYRSPLWGAVTVHHLLSHSSGIPDYGVTRDYYEVVNGFAVGETVDGMINEAREKDLEFAPGSRYAYSNIGYTLLGQIIEHQTDIRYDRYIQLNILEPMSMNSSKIHIQGNLPAENEAVGFRWSEEKNAYVSDDTRTLPATAPDAGLITTLNDFARWSQIYTGGEQNILTDKSITAMASKQIEMGKGGSVDAYGYGLGIGDRLIAHAGHVVGFKSQFVFDRQTNTLIAVFSNNSAINMEQVAFGLLTMLLSPDS